MNRLEVIFQKPREVQVAKELLGRIHRHQTSDDLGRLTRRIARETDGRIGGDNDTHTFSTVVKGLRREGYLVPEGDRILPGEVFMTDEARTFYGQNYTGQ